MKKSNPPNDSAVGVTDDGLKYWLHRTGQSRGHTRTVLTEDPNINLEEWRPGAPRSGGPSYLVNYHDTRIGVVLYDDPRQTQGRQEYFGHEKVTRIGDENDWTNVHTITAIGVPVSGYDPNQERDVYRTEMTWKEFWQGRREKFESKSEQNDVLRLLPYLLSAAKGGIPPKRDQEFLLSTELKIEVENGDLIGNS